VTYDDFLRGNAQKLLCLTLAAIEKEPGPHGAYKSRVYQIMMLASDLGYQTGFIQMLTDSGAPVITAVIHLPTGIIMFRMPWFLGAIGKHDAPQQKAAITEYLALPITGGAPTLHNGSNCCVTCVVIGPGVRKRCGDTQCKCHKRRG